MRTQTFAIPLAMAVAFLAPAAAQDVEVALQRAIQKETVSGDLKAAIQEYKKIAANAGGNRAVAAKALVHMAECYQKMGDAEARKIYEQVVREYADQKETVTLARARLGQSGPHPAGIVARQVWAPALDTEGAPSPDGRFLTYVDWSTGNLGIRNLATGEVRDLTNKGSWSDSGAYPLFSIFSPDGKQVAYAWDPNEGMLYELRIVAAGAGGKPRVLYHNPETQYVQPHHWSPDGKQILALMTKRDRTNQMVLVSVADGSTRVLKSFDWRAPTKMSFSPDGRYIAYDFPPQEESPARDIFVLGVDGSREFPVVEHSANDLGPIWSPDGRKILFLSDRTGANSLWSVAVSSGKPQGNPFLIRADIGRVEPMAITSTGTLFYGARTAGRDIYTAAIDLAKRKIEQPVKIPSRVEGENDMPEWSADGRYIAYIRGFGGDGPGVSKTICIHAMETGDERELRPRLGYFSWARWSPDGRFLLTSGKDRKGRPGVYRIDAQTAEVKAIVQGNPGEHLDAPVNAPMWSADGKSVFYVRASIDGTTCLLVREIESGREKEIVNVRGSFPKIRGWRISPDGTRIAFAVFDEANKSSALKMVPASGGDAREIAKLNPRDRIRTFEWEPAGRALLLYRSGAAGTELLRLSADGGQPENLDLTVAEFAIPRLDSMGKHIVYGAGSVKGEVWAIENLLPALNAKN